MVFALWETKLPLVSVNFQRVFFIRIQCSILLQGFQRFPLVLLPAWYEFGALCLLSDSVEIALRCRGSWLWAFSQDRSIFPSVENLRSWLSRSLSLEVFYGLTVPARGLPRPAQNTPSHPRNAKSFNKWIRDIFERMEVLGKAAWARKYTGFMQMSEYYVTQTSLYVIISTYAYKNHNSQGGYFRYGWCYYQYHAVSL